MKIKSKLKRFIVTEFLPGTQSEELSDELNLMDTGILDSLAVLKLVAYMENEFDIALGPEEIDLDNLNSINSVTAIVENKVLEAA